MSSQTFSSSSTSEPGWNHDVFLSFRGEDTRKNFTDHLYTALVQAGIHTFRDDDELARGKEISTELLNAIQESRISIVVFSKGYASSRWCLDELVQIMHCKKYLGHTVIPIFYDVNPSDIRKQTGTFAEAFARHEERFAAEMERVHKWRAALTEAADLSGWDLQGVANGYESRFIEKIVEDVLNRKNRTPLNVAVHPIGIDSRVEEMKALLNLGKPDVSIVGIYGMGGVGKTTIAKAVYNEICDGFEGSCFLLNIKEISEQSSGLIDLQERLLSDILKLKNLKIKFEDEGIKMIKERLCCKRVLVVLDDVDDLKQVHSLIGNSKWFGSGSRVIVTTKDEHLLTKLGVYGKYKVEELNFEESLQLFSWHAFGMAHPIEDYLELSIGVVKYGQGLPLALEVLGSFLLRRSISEWKSELEKLHKIPPHKIHKILRISFDSLDDDTVKNIFLDIACFFIGWDKENASRILNGCGFFPDIGISILIQKSLVTINNENELRMHDMIRDMGREIVREKSPGDLGKRSRLWFHEDVLNVLNKHMGSETVEGLILNSNVLDIHLKTEAFVKMKNLRLLQINGVHLTGCFEHLSKELRWLCWHKCPLKFLPQNLRLENLVVLDMQHSNVKQVWKEIKVFNKLQVLNLSNSKSLTKSPNFSQVPHLEILILKGCSSLVEVHESVGYMERLVSLNLEGCENLRNLPRSISNLKSLETLNLSGCLKIDELPEELGNMTALSELLADKTSIKQLPFSFGLLKNLKTLSLSGCTRQSSKSWLSCFSSWISPKRSNAITLLPASFSGLCYLKSLNLSDNNLCEGGICIDLGSLSSLQELNLSRNNFRNLPHGIDRLPKLRSLVLDACTSLQSISELPTSLEQLYADGCTSMERLSILSNKKSSSRFYRFYLGNCCKLVEIQGLESLESLPTFYMEGCNNLANDSRKNLLQCLFERDELHFIILPGSEVPNWFSHKRIGSSISFHVSTHSDSEIQGLLVWVVIATKKVAKEIFHSPSMMITNKTRDWTETCSPPITSILKFCEDHSVVCRFPLKIFKFEMESGDEIEVSIKGNDDIEVKKCGIHLLVNEPYVLVEYESMVQQVDSDTANARDGTMVRAKRGRDDKEAGPSNDWPNEEKLPKQSKMESEAQE